MPSTATDRLQGLSTSVAVKGPVRAVTTAAITLSGLQTVGGVALAEGDRVLVKNQSSAIENGIYNASTGSWTRAKDFDGNRDAVRGTIVVANIDNGEGLLYRTIATDPIVIGTSAITFTAIVDPNRIYDQTEAEALAGVTPTNYSYTSDPIIDPRRYSADPSGVLDSTGALRKACLVLQAAGGGVLDLADHTFKIYTDTGDTDPIGDFSGLTGIEIRSAGAKLVVNRAFASAVTIQVFKFTACHAITLGDLVGTNPTGARSEIYNRGAQMFWFYEGCSNINGGNLSLTDWSSGYHFIKQSSDPASYRSRNIRIANIKGLRTGYPLTCDDSGDNLEAQINSDSCGRSYICYNPHNHRVAVLSKNQDASADCLLYASQGGQMADVDLRYTNIDSTNAASGTKNGVHLAFRDGDVAPATMRNIKVQLHIENSPSFFTSGLVLDKLVASGAADTVDRGHTVSNIDISGFTDTSSGGVALMDATNWGAGENVSNIRIGPLNLVGGQPSFALTSLKDQAIFQNVVYGSALNVTGNATSRIIMIGVKATNTTTSTADTSQIDYIGCNITNGSTQSFINKTFLNTMINGVLALQGSKTYDPPSLGDGAETSTTVTVTGAAMGDLALASFSLSTQGIKLTAEVTATDTVTVNLHNKTGGTIDLASATLKARVLKA